MKKDITDITLYRIFLVWLDIILQMFYILKWLKELIKAEQLTKTKSKMENTQFNFFCFFLCRLYIGLSEQSAICQREK